MNLHELISEGIKNAMKAKDQTALNVLRALKSALKNAAIEKLGADAALDGPDALAVVRKQVKQRQDSLSQFEAAQRPDLAEKEKAEIVILEQFLPQPLSESEIAALVAEAMTEAGATSKAQMGAVMKLVNEKVAGRADGKTISSAVMKALGS